MVTWRLSAPCAGNGVGEVSAAEGEDHEPSDMEIAWEALEVMRMSVCVYMCVYVCLCVSI